MCQPPRRCRHCGQGHPESAALSARETAGRAEAQSRSAWWYRAYAKEQSAEDQKRYELAEKEAKAREMGLWRDPNPVPPWE